jgi:hypothetical protein
MEDDFNFIADVVSYNENVMPNSIIVLEMRKIRTGIHELIQWQANHCCKILYHIPLMFSIFL